MREKTMRGTVKVLPAVVSGLVLGVGLACGAPATAQQDQPRGSQSQASPSGGADRAKDADRGQDRSRDREGARDQGGDDGLDGVLQSYKSYRERSGKNVEQTRKEIDQMVRELSDLIAMRYRMAVALAGHRATQSGQGPGASASYPVPGQPGASYPGGGGGQARPDAQGSDEDSELAGREAMGRELEQVQVQLRNEIDQARRQADQLAGQIRLFRQQQQQQRQSGRARGQADGPRRQTETSGQDASQKKDRGDHRDAGGSR